MATLLELKSRPEQQSQPATSPACASSLRRVGNALLLDWCCTTTKCWFPSASGCSRLQFRHSGNDRRLSVRNQPWIVAYPTRARRTCLAQPDVNSARIADGPQITHVPIVPRVCALWVAQLLELMFDGSCHGLCRDQPPVTKDTGRGRRRGAQLRPTDRGNPIRTRP